MWVFPMGAAIVSGVFAAMIGGEYVTKRKPYEMAWSIALLAFAIASFAAGMGMLGGWTPLWYRMFFLLGAVVNVPFLGLGTIYLLGPRRIGHACAVLLAAATIFAAGAVFFADLNLAALAVKGRVPRSSLVLPDSTLLLARYFSFIGFFVVVGGALWSAWRLARKASDRRIRAIAMANILIAAGTSIVAGASGFIALGSALGSALFSIGLLAGVSVMFAGFLKTRVRTAPSEELTPPAEPPVELSAGSNE